MFPSLTVFAYTVQRVRRPHSHCMYPYCITATIQPKMSPECLHFTRLSTAEAYYSLFLVDMYQFNSILNLLIQTFLKISKNVACSSHCRKLVNFFLCFSLIWISGHICIILSSRLKALVSIHSVVLPTNNPDLCRSLLDRMSLCIYFHFSAVNHIIQIKFLLP